jgi:hypothetical protein
MSNPSEYNSLHGLEKEIELAIVESGYPLDVSDTPVTEWLSDPMDDERYETGLHGLLDAVKVVEDTAFPNAGPEDS